LRNAHQNGPAQREYGQNAVPEVVARSASPTAMATKTTPTVRFTTGWLRHDHYVEEVITIKRKDERQEGGGRST
jgi:hypothetical protein